MATPQQQTQPQRLQAAANRLGSDAARTLGISNPVIRQQLRYLINCLLTVAVAEARRGSDDAEAQ